MKNHKSLSSDAFNSLHDDEKQFVMECVACFHYKTGKQNYDGPAGKIVITPGELNNILAYALKRP